MLPAPDIPAMTRKPAIPSRAEIRQLVATHHAELRAVAGRGGNPHHTSLDQLDKVRTYAALLDAADGLAFLTMYTEESDAAARQTEVETDALRAALSVKEARAAQQARGLVMIIVFAVVALSWRACG